MKNFCLRQLVPDRRVRECRITAHDVLRVLQDALAVHDDVLEILNEVLAAQRGNDFTTTRPIGDIGTHVLELAVQELEVRDLEVQGLSTWT